MISLNDYINQYSVNSDQDKAIFERLYRRLSNFTKEEIIGKIISLNIQSKKLGMIYFLKL